MAMTKNTLASKHYMQSDEWASLRGATGWMVLSLSLGRGVVHAYRKKTPAGGIVYVPGFMPADKQEISAIAQSLKSSNLACKVEPCEPLNQEVCQWFEELGWKRARNVQYEHTVILDLKLNEDELWMGMKSRGRQEVNYARKAGVNVEEVEPTDENLEHMHRLLKDTSERKSFGIREKQGVLNFWHTFIESGKLRLFFARHEGKIIAGGIFITDGSATAWYKDAGSLPAYAKMFGPRLLLWEVALALKKDGFKAFDLGGTPGPEDYETSSMKGIYIFKSAYTREVTTMMPAYELPLKPLVYPLWNTFEPALLKLRRTVSKIKGKLLGR